MSTPRANVLSRLSAVCMVVMLAAGCTMRPVKETTATPPGQGAGTASSSIVTPVNPPFPGPYKTVEKDGVEYKQGRFPQGTFGGTLVQPMIASDPKTFNPWSAMDTVSAQLSGYMWSGLLTTDSYTGDVIPDLAAEYKIEPDHVTYTTRLRKGLKWSDGQPITADDVAFTFNTIIAQGYGNSSLRDVVSVDGQPPKVTVVDELTNKFVTAKPFAPFLRGALTMPIAPKHILEPLTQGKDGRKKFMEWQSQAAVDTSQMVTSGPFVLARFVPSQRVEFSRANNYYMVDPTGKQLPYLDRLVFLFIPEVMTNLLKFKAGDIDITRVRNRDVVELEKDRQRLNFNIYNLGEDSSSYFLMFNMNRRNNDKGKPYVTPYKSAWFNDLNFRQAVNHVLNRQQMIDGYLKGIGSPEFVDLPKTSFFYDKDLKPFTPDLDGAMKLLQKSGFQLKGTTLYDKTGHKVEFDLLAGSGGTMNEAIAGFIVNDLKKLGMKVNFQQMEFNSLADKLDQTKDWEACLYGLSGDPLEPNSGANVWKSDGRLHLFDQRSPNASGKIIVNDARPWEKELDEIFNAGVEEFDNNKRKTIYDKYEQIVYDQAPFIYLVSAMDMVTARNTIQNYQPTQLSQLVNGLHNIEEVWMQGSSQAK